jgi:4,5-DOPA dioxygenase extradiol
MPRAPAIFFGHGSPMNAIEDNAYTRVWAALGAEIARPRAILAVSAHWYIDGTQVTSMERPPTIHDFGGFPHALHEFVYPAPGEPAVAAQVAEALVPLEVGADFGWGLDHGTWSVLAHIYPHADVPIVQLSMDVNKPAEAHYEIGRRLARLRDDNVMPIGTGNVVHNLGAFSSRQARSDDWAGRFERRIQTLAETGDATALVNYAAIDADAALAVPTPEHYLPLLYVFGARQPDDAITFPTSGIVAGAISMLSVRIG